MKRLIASLLTLVLFLALIPVSSVNATPKPAELADSLPLAEYPIGSYFSKNGKACTCHNTQDCIASGKDCNCMRFYPTGSYSTCEVDLLGVQCIGFARYCQYRLFGFIDYGDTAYRYENLLGKKLSAYSWTAADAKKYITRAGVGGHIRISTHSIVIMEISENGFVSYECNGKTAASACRIYSRSFTWQSFYNAYGATDWRYLNMPKAEYLPTKKPADQETPSTTAPVTTVTPITTEAPITTVAPTPSIPPQEPDTPALPQEPDASTTIALSPEQKNAVTLLSLLPVPILSSPCAFLRVIAINLLCPEGNKSSL